MYVHVWDGETFVEDNTLLAGPDECSSDKSNVIDHCKLSSPMIDRDGSYVVQLREFEGKHSYISLKV